MAQPMGDSMWEQLHLIFLGLFVVGSFLHFRYLTLPCKEGLQKSTSRTSKRQADQKSTKKKGKRIKYVPSCTKAEHALLVDPKVEAKTVSTVKVLEKQAENTTKDETKVVQVKVQAQVLPTVKKTNPTAESQVLNSNVVPDTPKAECKTDIIGSSTVPNYKRSQLIAKYLKLKRAASKIPFVVNHASFVILPGTVNCKPGMTMVDACYSDKDVKVEKKSLLKFAPPPEVSSESASQISNTTLNAHADAWQPKFLSVKSRSSPALLNSTTTTTSTALQPRQSLPLSTPGGSLLDPEKPADDKDLCKYGSSCVRKGCTFLHSARPSASRTCRYDSLCTRAECHFAHPNGRKNVQLTTPMIPPSDPALPIPKIGFGRQEDNVTQNLFRSQLGPWQMNFVPMSMPAVTPSLPAPKHRVRILD